MLRYLTETTVANGWFLDAVIWICSLLGVVDPTIIRTVAAILIAAMIFYFVRFAVLFVFWITARLLA